MRPLLFGAAALFFVQWVQAQSNFESGYIITNKGDTVQGEINFNWVTGPEEVTFRASDSKGEKYLPADLKGFKIESGDYFQSLTVDVDVSPTNPDRLLEMGQDQFEEQSFFAKVLLLGSANLYQSFDQGRGRYHYFIENAQTPSPVELISGKRKVSDENTRQPNASGAFKAVDKYKGQLAYLLGDCSDVQKSIRAMNKLTENTARSIVDRYNACGGNVSTYQQDKSARRGTKCSIGFLLGAQMLDYDFENELLLPENLNTPFDLVHNIGAELKIGFSDRKNFGMSVLFFHRSFKTSETFFEDRPVVDGFSRIDHSFDQLVFMTMANLNIGVGQNQLFFHLGPGIGLASGAAGTKTFETGTVVHLTARENDRQFLLNFGTGYQWKQLRASFDLEFGGSMPPLSTVRSRAASLRLTYFILQ